jgi:hypothetical protein
LRSQAGPPDRKRECIIKPAFGDVERRGSARGYGAPVRYAALELATHLVVFEGEVAGVNEVQFGVGHPTPVLGRMER